MTLSFEERKQIHAMLDRNAMDDSYSNHDGASR